MLIIGAREIGKDRSVLCGMGQGLLPKRMCCRDHASISICALACKTEVVVVSTAVNSFLC